MFLQNLQDILPALLDLIQYVAYITGFAFAASGVGGLMRVSTDPRSHYLARPVTDIGIGGIFISNGYWIPLLVSSFTTDYTSTSNVLSYLGQSNGLSPMEETLRTIVVFAQILGVLAILRGLYHFRVASNIQSATIGQGEDKVLSGISFVAFGALAANMSWTLQTASWLFGFPVPSFLM